MVLLLPVVVAALVVLLVGTTAGAVLLADGRAQDVADEAALAAVRAMLDGTGRPCDRAQAVAGDAWPGTGVATCRVHAGGAVSVTVEVRLPSPLARRLVGAVRQAEAAASGVPG